VCLFANRPADPVEYVAAYLLKNNTNNPENAGATPAAS
jgi:hypothetical protein